MYVSPEAVGLPPLNPVRKDIYDYYKISFLPDGYPGKMMAGGVVPHPIYGTYVVTDYLIQHAAEPSRTDFIDAAKKVGDAAISRMHTVGDSLVFYYTPETALTSLPGTFFSGLTQARYVSTFARLWEVTGDSKYREAADGALASLLIPLDQGGVLRPSHGGAVIEEWPNLTMPDFTLNGWTTAVDQVAIYAKLTGSQQAKDLLEQNLIALRALLPLYDVPEVANSRYRLSGRTPVRILVKGATAEFVSGEVVVPEIGVFPYEVGTTNNWSNYKYDGDKLVFNTNLNYITFPEPNRLRFVIRASGEANALIQIQTGDYTPLRNGVANKKLVTIADHKIREGINLIEATVPWDVVPYIAYPTTHTKRIADKNFNAYHHIHVNNLERLHKSTGDEILRGYAELWKSYIQKWPSMPVYSDNELEYEGMTEWQSRMMREAKAEKKDVPR